MRRVVVTGLGAVTPVGNTVADTWASLLAGKHGIAPITKFDTADYKATLAAEVKGFDPPADHGPQLCAPERPVLPLRCGRLRGGHGGRRTGGQDRP